MGAAISTWVAIDILGGLPHQIDEVVYLLQARWLLDGEVAPAASVIQDHLRVPFTYLVDGRWIGHYPIGWPVLLAGGLAVGAPHLVDAGPRCRLRPAALSGRSRDRRRAHRSRRGVAGGGLAARPTSVRFHVPAHRLRRPRPPRAVVAAAVAPAARAGGPAPAPGAAMGCCLAVRPMTAVAVSMVLGGWLVLDALSCGAARAIEMDDRGAAAAGPVSWRACPTLVHNAVVTGKPAVPPLLVRPGHHVRPRQHPLRDPQPRRDPRLGLVEPHRLGLAARHRRARPRPAARLCRRSRFSCAAPAARTGSCSFSSWSSPSATSRPGPTACTATAPATSSTWRRASICSRPRGFRELARWARPSRTAVTAVVALFLALNLTALAVLPARLALYRGYYDVTGELERQLAATGLDEAIILVEGDDWEPWGEAARLMTGPRRHEIIVAADLEGQLGHRDGLPRLAGSALGRRAPPTRRRR